MIEKNKEIITGIWAALIFFIMLNLSKVILYALEIFLDLSEAWSTVIITVLITTLVIIITFKKNKGR